MDILEKKRNQIFYLLLLLTVGYLIWGVMIGKNQDEQFRKNNNDFQATNDLIGKQQYQEASVILKDLVQKYPNSYLVNWQYGIVLDSLAKDDEALDTYMKVQKLKPFIVKNQYYLTQVGQIYYNKGNYSEAQKYLVLSANMGDVQELKDLSTSLLEEIASKASK